MAFTAAANWILASIAVGAMPFMIGVRASVTFAIFTALTIGGAFYGWYNVTEGDGLMRLPVVDDASADSVYLSRSECCSRAPGLRGRSWSYDPETPTTLRPSPDFCYDPTTRRPGQLRPSLFRGKNAGQKSPKLSRPRWREIRL
jgi:hypothetical protein